MRGRARWISLSHRSFQGMAFRPDHWRATERYRRRSSTICPAPGRLGSSNEGSSLSRLFTTGNLSGWYRGRFPYCRELRAGALTLDGVAVLPGPPPRPQSGPFICCRRSSSSHYCETRFYRAQSHYHHEVRGGREALSFPDAIGRGKRSGWPVRRSASGTTRSITASTIIGTHTPSGGCTFSSSAGGWNTIPNATIRPAERVVVSRSGRRNRGSPRLPRAPAVSAAELPALLPRTLRANHAGGAQDEARGVLCPT